MIVLFAFAAAAAPCDVPATAEVVVAALDASEASFAAMNVDAFTARADELLAMLPCLDVPLASTTVARVHRLQGIRAFVARDADLTVRAFAAARRLEPEYRLAETLVPDGHPLRTDYTAMDPTAITTELAPRPKEGRVTFDGLELLERPVEVPSYLQRFDRAGAVVASEYLVPGEPIPAYPARRTVHPLERPLLVGAGLSAGVALGTLLGAVASHAAYEGLDTSTAEGQDRLDPLRGRTNTLLVASAVSAGITLGAGAGLAVVVAR